MNINNDLAAASSAPLVLAIVAEADSHGFHILERVRDLSGERPAWPDGMLYPALHRLERLGYLAARWEAAGGRRRKYYSITSAGLARLAEERRRRQTADATLRDREHAPRRLSPRRGFAPPLGFLLGRGALSYAP